MHSRPFFLPFLRAEGIIVLLAALYAYHSLSGSWLFFAILLLVPDISLIGYLRNARTGAVTYNMGHTYVLPCFLLLWGHYSGNAAMMQIALIWTAHIGMDRMLGFGLKNTTGFRDTHLGKL